MSPNVTAELGRRIRERRGLVKMDETALAYVMGVPVTVVQAWETGTAEEELTVGKLDVLAEALGTTISDLAPEPLSDLDEGVRVQLAVDSTSLTGVRRGTDYYIYHCLVRSRAVPMLIPLLVDVLVGDRKNAQFNGGHAGHEFIYVLQGEIHMQWGDESNPKEADLPVGANVYISPYVSHTFTANGDGSARLLAVNF